MESTFDKLKELNLSRDEVDRIGDALKKPEFRKLLSEYVQELQDPENKKIYEQEIIELEKERGIEVTFIHPKPGYVIKTSVNGTQKAFINICTNEIVGKPSSSPTVKEGTKGLTWSLPHTLSPPREDIDNKQARCQVFDVIFHPDTLHLAERNKSFRTMINNTALDAVENNFDVKLDKKNLKFPKLTYKGNPNPSVIRKPTDTKPVHTPEEKQLFDRIFSKAEASVKNSPKKQKTPRRGSVDDKSDYTTPKYVIKHRTHVDIQEFTENRDSKMLAAIPKELIIEVNLPLLKSSSEMQLDVNEKTVQLISEKPAKYKLNLTLPYRVTEVAGNAKFDKDTKKLIITLPVKRSPPSSFSEFSDSGVESDHGSPGSPSSEEEVISVAKIVVSSETEPSEKCTEKSTEFRTSFLDDDVHYSLPEFTCHMFENTIAFTLNVKNVDERSVCKQFASNNQVHLKFVSISSSFYPSHYAFYVRFPEHTLNSDDTTIEVWDNNVVLQVPVNIINDNNCDNNSTNVPLTSYLYGIHGDQVERKYIEEPSIINRMLEEKLEEEKENEIVMPSELIKTENVTHPVTNVEVNNQPSVPQDIHKPTKAIDIVGTSYESSGDELSFNSYSPRKCKGILKQRRLKRFGVGRSVSESSLDDFIFSSSSFENCHIGGGCLDAEIPEEEDVESSTSLKKTVRFNDVIMKQMFRSNSSILGQKKKNQRKAKNKKRAMERRHSESEASEVEDKKERDLNDFDRMQPENSTKKEDHHDIFHLDIDN